jgi:hypothetical protein
MISTKTPSPTDKPTAPTPRRKRQPGPSYSAQEKAQAILTLWTERCKPVDLCRQMRVNWITLQQWQQRAMEGMLQALQSRVNLSQGGALSPRLQNLLQKQNRAVSADKLTQRLTQLQQSKVANPPGPGA